MSQNDSWRPSLYRSGGYYNLTYDLPQRTYAAQAYPVRGPNGSSIVITAHQRGLSVVWRGGRRYTTPPQNQVGSSIVQSGKDAIMVIDSEDDEPSEQTKDELAFESEDELDLASENHPPSILYSLEISLDSAALSIAFPPLPHDTSNQSPLQLPSIFSHKIVVVVGSADGSVRLLAIPLAPPSPKNSSKPTRSQMLPPGVEELVIASPRSTHKSPVRCVSLTWTSAETHSLPASDDEDDIPSPEGTHRLRRRSGEQEQQTWELIIMSHSVDPLNVLATSSITLPASSHIADCAVQTLRPYYLSSPAANISFNPSRYPTRRHTHLLVAESSGAVRIYNPLALKRTSRSNSGIGRTPPWLATFNGPFQEPSKSHELSRRKRILDAKWTFNGKCVVVLLEDGEWGIWDIWGIGPASKRILFRGESALSSSGGVSGAGTTPFAVRGMLGDPTTRTTTQAPSRTRALAPSRNAAESTQRLAPMTPNTRKTKQQALFSSSSANDLASTTIASSNSNNNDSDGNNDSTNLAHTQFPTIPSRGGIALTTLASSFESTSSLTASPAATDETLLLHLNNTVYCIPSLLSYWQRTANSNSNSSGQTSVTGTLYGPSVAELTPLSVSGESINCINLFPHPQASNSSASDAGIGMRKLRNDVLVTGEHRIVILTSATSRAGQAAAVRNENTAPAGAAESHSHLSLEQQQPKSLVDQELLAQGELDIMGVDRVLDGMTSSTTGRRQNGKPAFQPRGAGAGVRAGGERKVGFATDY